MKCFFRESLREKFRESFVKTCSNISWNAFSRCQNRVQNVPKSLLKHFRQWYRKSFWKVSGNIWKVLEIFFYIFSFIKKCFQGIFLKPFRNISGNDTGNLFKWLPYNLPWNILARFRKYCFYIFTFIKKPFQERFLKPFRNISRNVSLEKFYEQNFV